MSVIDIYFGAKKRVHEYFGYISNWKEIPMEDGREYYWMLFNNKIVYSPDKFTPDIIVSGMSIYSAEIYNQRHLDKYIYKNEDYTMISIDTRTDGNKFLMIFSNNLECKDEDLKNIYEENW